MGDTRKEIWKTKDFVPISNIYIIMYTLNRNLTEVVLTLYQDEGRKKCVGMSQDLTFQSRKTNQILKKEERKARKSIPLTDINGREDSLLELRAAASRQEDRSGST